MGEREERFLALCGRLREIREGRAISLEEASSRTRIRVPLLEALEAGRIEELPGLVYARGFIRTYLNFLGVSGLWEEFEAVLPKPETEGFGNVIGSTASPAKGFRKISRGWLYLLLVLCFAAALYVVWEKRSQVRQVTPPPAAEAEREPESVETQQAAELPPSVIDLPEPPPSVDFSVAPIVSVDDLDRTAETAASPDLSDDIAWLKEISVDVAPLEEVASVEALRIIAHGACWIRVSEDDKVLFQGTLQKGDSKTFDIKGRTQCRFGNAANVDVHWQSESRAPLSGRADVLTCSVEPGQALQVLR